MVDFKGGDAPRSASDVDDHRQKAGSLGSDGLRHSSRRGDAFSQPAFDPSFGSNLGADRDRDSASTPSLSGLTGRFSSGAPEQDSSSSRQPFFSAPAIVTWLLAAFWGVFVFLALAPNDLAARIGVYLALSPADLAANAARVGPYDKAAGLIGHMFVHSGFQHIATNSLLFLAFGVAVARRLAATGGRAPLFADTFAPTQAGPRASVLFLAFFLLSGAAGALAFAVLYWGQPILLVGASGGVSGLFGAVVRLMNRRSPQFTPGRRPLAALTDPTVLVLTAVFVVMNIAQGVFGFGLSGADIDIAWEAHLGGYFFGLIAFPFFDALARAGAH